MKREIGAKKDYTEKFVQCQKAIKDLLSRPPIGVQNWSYQKSVNFKKQVKSCEPALKLLPKSQHTDFLKMEQLLNQLKEYYK